MLAKVHRRRWLVIAPPFVCLYSPCAQCSCTIMPPLSPKQVAEADRQLSAEREAGRQARAQAEMLRGELSAVQQGLQRELAEVQVWAG